MVGRAVRDRGVDLGPIPNVVAVRAGVAAGMQDRLGNPGRGRDAALTPQVARLLVGRPVLRRVRQDLGEEPAGVLIGLQQMPQRNGGR